MSEHDEEKMVIQPRTKHDLVFSDYSDVRRFVICLFSGLFVLILLSGCAAYHDQQISPEKNLTDLQNRRLDKTLIGAEYPSIAQAGLIEEESWDLSCLTLAACMYNSDLAAARAQWKMEQGHVMTSRELPNPNVSVAPGYNTTTDPDVISSWIFNAALDLPLGIPVRRGARIARAQYLSDAARLNLEGAVWELRNRVRQAYFDIYEITLERSLLQEEQSILETKTELLRQLSDIGEISHPELTRAEIQLDTVKFAIQNTAPRLTATQAGLADAIGVPVSSLAGVALSFREFDSSLPDLPAETVRREAMLNNTRLLQALAEYDASQKELELAVLNRYPGITIGPGYEYDQGDDKWSLGISLELPVLTRHTGSIVEAEEKCKEKAAIFNSVQTNLNNATESAISRYGETMQSLKAADTMVRSISGLVDKEIRLQRIGELGSLDLIDTRLRLISAQQDLLAARITAFRALSDIENAIQLPCFGASWDMNSLKSKITGNDR